MRINLKVPFEDKDKARAAGARWDVARKTWYVENAEDLKPFAPWISEEVQAWFSGKKPLRKTSKRL